MEPKIMYIIANPQHELFNVLCEMLGRLIPHRGITVRINHDATYAAMKLSVPYNLESELFHIADDLIYGVYTPYNDQFNDMSDYRDALAIIDWDEDVAIGSPNER